MIDIHPLKQLSADEYKRLVVGYTSEEAYIAKKTESTDRVVISLDRVTLRKPHVKTWPYSEETFKASCGYLDQGTSGWGLCR
jgi:hypothetical protein